MELLSRYLQAIKASLPQSQRDDIAEEISADILSRADEREADLGRPLTLAEETAILKQYGHPRIVASRYAKVQYLIGPSLFPFYWYTLRIVVICAILLGFFVGILQGSGRGNLFVDVPEAWASLWSIIFASIGVVTVIFAVIERIAVDPLAKIGVDKWDPRKLPPFTAQCAAWLSTTSSIFELVFDALALGWLIGLARSGYSLFLSSSAAHAAAAKFSFAPVAGGLLVPIIIALMLNMACICGFLIRPSLLVMRVATRILFNLFCIAVGAILITTPTILAIAGQPGATDALRVVFRAALALQMLVGIWEVYRDARLLLPKSTTPAQPIRLGIL